MSTITRVEVARVAPTVPRDAVGSAIAHSLLEAYADRFSERIVTSIIADAKSVDEVSMTQGIPLSTCYRRIQQLLNAGLIVIERIVVTGSGKRYATYRSCYRSLKVVAGPKGIEIEAELNEDIAEKVRDRRLSFTYADQGVGWPR